MDRQQSSSGTRSPAPESIGRDRAQGDDAAAAGGKALRSHLAPLIGAALLIGIVAAVPYAFDYLTADQYLVSTDDAYLTTAKGETYVIARFKESEIAYVAIGQAVTIEPRSAGDVRLYGYVADIASAGEDRPRQHKDDRIAVEIALRESRLPAGLQPGMQVRSTINTGLTDHDLLAPTIPKPNAGNACRAPSMPLGSHQRAIDILQRI